MMIKTRRYGSVQLGVVVVEFCECGGMVRNDIFPDTPRHKYPY